MGFTRALLIAKNYSLREKSATVGVSRIGKELPLDESLVYPTLAVLLSTKLQLRTCLQFSGPDLSDHDLTGCLRNVSRGLSQSFCA